ncbi:MAG: GDSL family lipase [Acholeplasmataceae bacterium]|nr:GDSL family lipase [Acholeplasmataceae bacterium]
MICLEKNDKILFNGDSITDASRDRNDEYSLAGYSTIISENIGLLRPDLNIICYNRGVGGDTSKMLLARLENELRAIRPTVFSLLIGVNDTWRRYDSNTITTVAEFGKNIDSILTIVERYTKKIIIIEPFIIMNVDPDKLKFYDDLNPKIIRLRQIAQQYQVEYIPMDGVFSEKCCHSPANLFTFDGVHPTDAGNALLAKEWLNRVYFENNKED